MINYIDIILIVVTLLIIYTSSRKGLLVSLVSLTRTFVGIPLSYYVSDRFYQSVYDNYLKSVIIEKIEEKVNEQGSVTSFIDSLQDTINSLPAFLTQNFNSKPLEEFSVQKASEYIELNIVRPVALVVVEVAIFVATLLVFFLVTGLVMKALKLRNKRKHAPLRRTDKLLGGVFGVFKAGMLLFTVCTICAMICNALPDDYENVNQLVYQINNSRIINLIGSFNPLT